MTLEWVGRYVGAASGVYDGVNRDQVPVVMLITFDAPALPTCASCITVRVDGFFDRMNLLPQSPIAATWSYANAGEQATLTLQKFSSSAAPGSVFFGTVRIAPENSDGTTGEPTTSFDFLVERQ